MPKDFLAIFSRVSFIYFNLSVESFLSVSLHFRGTLFPSVALYRAFLVDRPASNQL